MSPAPAEHPLQPLLNDAVIALRAPTQVWSGRDGDIGGAAIDGVYHGDLRHIRGLTVTCADSPIEWISATPEGPDRVVFGGLLRAVDDTWPDPKVRLVRDRRVAEGRLVEMWTVSSALSESLETRLALRIEPEFAWLHEVKSGRATPRDFGVTVSDVDVAVSAGDQGFVLVAPGAEVARDDDAVVATWTADVPARGSVTFGFEIALQDDVLVVQSGRTAPPWDAKAIADSARGQAPRVARWLEVALADLDALRLALPMHPDDEFYAAGAPWFFTLFGRDSIWAARLALPLDVRLAASTLRVLARMQGTTDDPATAEEPGKILHELRATALELPDEGISLPPRYYGSVDATPLWICLLADAWRAGMAEAEVRDLLPALRAALRWVLDYGDSDGDGFLDYIDRMGTGLANQGWKDSGDSIQWRDGSLAKGPIALCEVQGYAYEAVRGGADLLEALGESDEEGLDPSVLREWASAMRDRFAESFWITTPEGRYPAVALDRDKQPVDTLTSNIGHLLGTGILDRDDEARIAELLAHPSMSSGFGIRTMSTGAAGYWPLSYHGGSVWMHDTAICAWGMARAGLTDAARAVAEGMLAAAEGFGFRVPELHSGDGREVSARPTPYPAACRPQAWSAAAAVTALQILG